MFIEGEALKIQNWNPFIHDKMKFDKKIFAPGGIRTHVLRLNANALPLSHGGFTLMRGKNNYRFFYSITIVQKLLY